ncbi:MAG: nuclear transport factor 2 family protein [Cyanobacteria bacterium P01_H01_bin.15]
MDQKEIISKRFRDYFRAFESRDPEQVAQYFSLPIFLIKAREEPINIATKDMLLVVIQQCIVHLANIRHHSTELGDIQTQLLSPDLALVTGTGRYLRKNQQLITEFGYTYAFRKTGTTWQIMIGMIHDAKKTSSQN